MILACTLESQRQWPSDGTFNHVETVHLKECFEMKRELLTFQWISPKRICCVRKSIPKPRWGCIAWWKSPKRGSAVAVFGSCSGWAFFLCNSTQAILGAARNLEIVDFHDFRCFFHRKADERVGPNHKGLVFSRRIWRYSISRGSCFECQT